MTSQSELTDFEMIIHIQSSHTCYYHPLPIDPLTSLSLIYHSIIIKMTCIAYVALEAPKSCNAISTPSEIPNHSGHINDNSLSDDNSLLRDSEDDFVDNKLSPK